MNNRDLVNARLVSVALAVGLLLCASAANAQDSFEGTPARRPAEQKQPQPASQRTVEPALVTSKAVGETQDFGVKPTSQLRASNELHGPTPTAIPGGKVVGTQQLAQWMQGQQNQQGRVMLLHAIGSNRHLPNAIPAAPASQGGSFDDTVQRDYGTYLQSATNGDKGRLLVTYCAGVQCWGSYNAALRAIKMGYTNVHWYRGGIEAWENSGLPVMTAQEQVAAPAQNQSKQTR